ncbi:uncharacterized protein LOC111083922 [Limulus polyphemus]|uniref:Uncharacterized protein LOC111083922 n=1 Tax=Limulus polyphemus TaxID=6850 RepID=A0ABM1RYB5_LIMPO|nr:uncharacterized protein LOC111083922 [Limulus polyphemus]
MEIGAAVMIVLLIVLTIQMFQCRPTQEQNIRHNRVLNNALSKLYKLLNQRTSSPSKFSRFIDSSNEGTIFQSLDPLSGGIVVKRSLNSVNEDRSGRSLYTLIGGTAVRPSGSLRDGFVVRPMDTLNRDIVVRSLDPLKRDIIPRFVDSSIESTVNRFLSPEKVMVKSHVKSTTSSNFKIHPSGPGENITSPWKIVSNSSSEDIF